MNSRRNEYLFLLIGFFLLGSCVPPEKYQALQEVNTYLEGENKSLKGVEEKNRNLSAKLRQANSDLDKKQQELIELRASFSSLDRNYKDLANRYNNLITQNRNIIGMTASEKQNLVEELARKQLLLDEKERTLRTLELGLSDRERQVAELTRLLQAKDVQMSAIKNRLSTALRGFAAEDLSVTERDGKIYVSLSQNLLFKSGSYQIDAKGRQAIQRLAKVLNENSDITINIEGHTDTDGTPASNWDLSVKRATSVVKELIHSGVQPTRVLASGRGQYAPIAPNSTKSGKAQNRRTEIILSPKLDALYDIIRGSKQ